MQPGEYVVGWIKRGPVGVIGTNKSDAAQTVRHLVADLAGRAPRGSETDLLEVWRARGIEPTTFAQWQAIDAAEIAKGAARGRARTKIDTWQELLEVCRAQRETAG